MWSTDPTSRTDTAPFGPVHKGEGHFAKLASLTSFVGRVRITLGFAFELIFHTVRIGNVHDAVPDTGWRRHGRERSLVCFVATHPQCAGAR
jgi:hypothetical protein